MSDQERNAMQMALEALERSMEAGMTRIKVDQAIAALRQALNVDTIDTSATCVDENEKRERKPWVGLTEDDLRQIILAAVGVAEAKLKEKNNG